MMWVNGELSSQLPVNDRGLLYGDGVWETIAVRHGQAQLLAEHLVRLQKGLTALALEADVDAIAEQVALHAQPYASAVLKIIVTRGVGQRGYHPATATQPTVIIDIIERSPDSGATTPADAYQRDGISLGVCKHTRLAHQPLLAGFKHLNRLEQVLARAEMHKDWQEALVQDYAGNVIEGTMSNVFFLLPDGQWLTPDLSQCGIAGIMREQVLSVFQAANIPCVIRDVPLAEALSAPSLFMCNSLIGIWPVSQVIDNTASMKKRVIPAMVRELQTRMKSRL